MTDDAEGAQVLQITQPSPLVHRHYVICTRSILCQYGHIAATEDLVIWVHLNRLVPTLSSTVTTGFHWNLQKQSIADYLLVGTWQGSNAG